MKERGQQQDQQQQPLFDQQQRASHTNSDDYELAKAISRSGNVSEAFV